MDSPTTTNSADVFLAQQCRRRKLILGDGNCFFRAVAHVREGNQEKHASIRQRLVSFVEANRNMFEVFVMNGTFEQHITTMRRQGAWATQVEIYTAVTLLQTPFYVCSLHPATQKYRWLLYKPRDCSSISFQNNSFPRMKNHLSY